MKARYLILILSLLSFQTHAYIQAADEVDLTDILSPAELIEEFNIDDSPLSRKYFWNSSYENPRLRLIINKAEKGTAPDAQTLEAYVDDVLVYKFKVSTGKETPIKTTSGKMSSRRTPVGTYRIGLRSRNHVSKTWVGASMPFAQFFNGGIAVHATTKDHFSALGRRDSGGCVRLHPTNAQLIWDLVGKMGVDDTLVTVYDGSKTLHPYGQPNSTPLAKDTASTPSPQVVVPAPSYNSELTAKANQEQIRIQRERQLKYEEEYRKYEEELRKYNEAMKRRKEAI